MSNIRFLTKTVFIANSVFLITSCMTSSKQEQLEAQMNKLQEQVDQQITNHSKSDLSSKNDLDDLKNQIQLTQGSVDELGNRVKKIEQNSGTVPVASSNVTTGLVDVDETTMIKRQIARLQLVTNSRLNPNRVGKLPHSIKNAADVDKVLKSEFANNNFKQVEQTATAILNAKGITDDMIATALEYRGESKFQQHDYKGAAVDLSGFIELFPKSKRYPRALLLVGDSYVYLKNNNIAVSYYQECAKHYPEQAEGKAAASRLESMPHD